MDQHDNHEETCRIQRQQFSTQMLCLRALGEDSRQKAFLREAFSTLSSPTSSQYWGSTRGSIRSHQDPQDDQHPYAAASRDGGSRSHRIASFASRVEAVSVLYVKQELSHRIL